MKSFSKFIKEAVTAASQQAKRLGLQGDGHGDWYDREGNLVAKTVGGQLKMFGSKGGKPEEQQPQQSQQQEPEQEPVEKTKGALTVGFGRFNPPTIGHEKLLNHIKKVADKGEYRIYPSHSQDAKKNPLDSETKVDYMKKMYPDHANNIVHDTKMRSIFDVLKNAHEQGHSSVNIVVGADRLKEFETLANKYNGKLYDFEQINVISAGERDPDAEGVEGMSASKLRKHAVDGDFDTFSKGLPKALDKESRKKLYNTIRKNMGIEEEYQTWEIAPKLDYKNLRENYISGKIFQVGKVIENMNTGLIGKIIRTGTNYVICVTEAGDMFKSWIRDVSEVYEFGTDEYRRYVQRITPNEPIRDFINNRRKKYHKKNDATLG